MAASGDFLGQFGAVSGKARAAPAFPCRLEETSSREDARRRLPEGGGEHGPQGFAPPGLVLVSLLVPGFSFGGEGEGTSKGFALTNENVGDLLETGGLQVEEGALLLLQLLLGR